MTGIDADKHEMKQLERQVERGQLFTHTALSKQFTRLSEAETFLYGLVDLLMAKGIILEQELRDALLSICQELAARGELSGPGIAIQPEEPTEAPPPIVAVDCAARMHICHAICCKLDFALTVSEIEAGNVKWDLGRPYFIRHEIDGYCTHSQRTTGHCGIYAHRPEICRSYSCANDARIWKDFEQMELNTDWLTENLFIPQDANSNVEQPARTLPLLQVTRQTKKANATMNHLET